MLLLPLAPASLHLAPRWCAAARGCAACYAMPAIREDCQLVPQVEETT